MIVANDDIGVSHVPRTTRVGCTLGIGLHTQVHISRMAQSVGLKGGRGSGVEIVAIVAHQGFDARLFTRKVCGAEGCSSTQKRLLASACQQRVGYGIEMTIFDGVEIEK